MQGVHSYFKSRPARTSRDMVITLASKLTGLCVARRSTIPSKCDVIFILFDKVYTRRLSENSKFRHFYVNKCLKLLGALFEKPYSRTVF